MKALSNSQKDFSSITAAEAELLTQQFQCG
jgi:hypothetical protein